jgi:FkbM family methyltransferase
VRNPLIDILRPHHFRGKLRLLDKVVPHTGKRAARVFGARVELDLTDAIQRWIYMGVFEPEETAIVRTWLHPGMTFLDVGANVGYFTLLAASRVGVSGRVHAIEPSPYAFGRAADTVSANALHMVRLHQLGLSDTEGELTLYVQADGSGFHSPSMSPEIGGEPVAVAVRRLDDLLDEAGIDTVDLMKLDVEGHELHVLRGGRSALESGRVRAVLCEFNEHWLRAQGESSRALYDALLAAGFQDRKTTPPEFGPGTFETRFFVHRTALPLR